MTKRYRIKNQFRFTAFLTLMILLSIIMVNTLVGFNHAESMTKTIYSEIQVEYGDTLWELARVYGPEDSDTRKLVHEICSINQIEADSLYPGQVILIPQTL